MSQKMKSIAAIAALGVASFGLYSTVSIASPSNNHQMMKLQPANKPMMRIIRIKKIIKLQRKKPGFWNLGLYRNKHLSENNARTIVKAALLMRNRHDLSVGKISTKYTPRNLKMYSIQIINQNKQIVSKVLLNSASGKIRPMRLRHPKKS